MKTVIVALLFGFIGGAAVTYSQTSRHYETKANELVKAVEEAEDSRLLINKDVVDKLYVKYYETITAEPVVVDRIVRVKATCPVQPIEVEPWIMQELPLKSNLPEELFEALSK